VRPIQAPPSAMPSELDQIGMTCAGIAETGAALGPSAKTRQIGFSHSRSFGSKSSTTV
jgi:hypothetical protein